MRTKQSPVQRKLVSLSALMLLGILPACSTMTTVSSAPTSTTKVACQAFAPITWSGKDTAITVEQVKEHNAAGKELCGWGRK